MVTHPAALGISGQRVQPVLKNPVRAAHGPDVVGGEARVSHEHTRNVGLRVGIPVDPLVHHEEQHRPRRTVGRGGVKSALAGEHVAVDHPSAGLTIGGDQSPSEGGDLREFIAQPGVETEPRIRGVRENGRARPNANEQLAVRGRGQIVPDRRAGSVRSRRRAG